MLQNFDFMWSAIKTGLRGGVWEGRVSISSLTSHCKISPKHVVLLVGLQTQLKILTSSFLLLGRDRSFMYEQVAQSARGNPVAEKLKTEAVKSGALIARGQRGSGGSQSKSITRMQTMPGAESENLSGAAMRTIQYWSRQHHTRGSPVDLTFLSRCLQRFRRH